MTELWLPDHELELVSAGKKTLLRRIRYSDDDEPPFLVASHVYVRGDGLPLRVLGLTALRLCELESLGSGELRREGYPSLSSYRENWNRWNARSGYPWSRNPFVWRVRFVVDEAAPPYQPQLFDLPGGAEQRPSKPKWSVVSNHVLFSGGPLHPFSRANMLVSGRFFPTVQHYLGWQKALLAGDEQTAEAIRIATSPLDAQRLANTISFKSREKALFYSENLLAILTAGLVGRLESNPDLAGELKRLRAGDDPKNPRTFIYCSTFDRQLGVGVGLEDFDETTIGKRGQNLLGLAWDLALSQARDLDLSPAVDHTEGGRWERERPAVTADAPLDSPEYEVGKKKGRAIRQESLSREQLAEDDPLPPEERSSAQQQKVLMVLGSRMLEPDLFSQALTHWVKTHGYPDMVLHERAGKVGDTVVRWAISKHLPSHGFRDVSFNVRVGNHWSDDFHRVTHLLVVWDGKDPWVAHHIEHARKARLVITNAKVRTT